MKAWINNLNARNVVAENESKEKLTTKSSGVCAKNLDATTREYNADILITLGERKYSCSWKEMALGRIERILKFSHVSIINFGKKVGGKLDEDPKKALLN